MKRVLLIILILLTPACIVVGGQTSARSCSAEPPSGVDVDHITLTPNGPISMPADEAINLTAIAYDSSNNQLNIPIAWSSTSGSIQNFGGGQARWYPESMGTQSVIACSGDVEQVLNAQVQPGEPIEFRLSVLDSNISADETVSIFPELIDQYGNSWNPNIPFSSWLLPEGMSIFLPNDGTAPTLTPGPVGVMSVSVDWEGWSNSVSLNVSRGVVSEIFIEHDSLAVSSDYLVDLCARYMDQRGNTWLTNVDWSILGPPDSSSLSSEEGQCTTFDPGLSGDWTIQIDDGNGMLDQLTLSVEPGRLAYISLDILSNSMHIGDTYVLNAEGFDAAGNSVIVDGWNWSVTDGPSTNPIVQEADAYLFSPDKVGQHTLQVMAAGRVQAIDVEVLFGVPVSLDIEVILGPNNPAILTGSSLDLRLYGVDQNGNRNLVDVPPEGWFVLNNYGTIENASVGGTGHYTYISSGIGDVSITTFLGQAEGSLIVNVLQGPLSYLELDLPVEGDQGTSVKFSIQGFDVSGNPVDIHQCSATITTDAGDASCDENGWVLDLKKPGQLVVHAHVQSAQGASAEGSSYITTHSTWLGWGNNTQVLISASLLLIISISVILVVVFRNLGSRIEEEMDFLKEESEGESNEEGDGSGVNVPSAETTATIIHFPLDYREETVRYVMSQHGITDAMGYLQHARLFDNNGNGFLSQIELNQAALSFVSDGFSSPQINTKHMQVSSSNHLVSSNNQTNAFTDEQLFSTGWTREQIDAARSSGQITHPSDNEGSKLPTHDRGYGPIGIDGVHFRPLPNTDLGADGWYFDAENRPVHWRFNIEKGWLQE